MRHTDVLAVAWNGSGTKLATVSISCISGGDNERRFLYLHIVTAANGEFEREVDLVGGALDGADDAFFDAPLGWSPCETKIAASSSGHVAESGRRPSGAAS